MYETCVCIRNINRHVQRLEANSHSEVRGGTAQIQTILRLKLNGRLLLAPLYLPILPIHQALPDEISRTFYGTDSAIVLDWINTSSHTLKTSAANRVAEIQTKAYSTDWRHVSTSDNPTDLISRSQSPEEYLCLTI